LLRHVLHAGSLNPAVVEVEHGANGDGIVDGLIGPAGIPELLYVLGAGRRGRESQFFEIGEQLLFGVLQQGAAVVGDA
jgi:hypothetical protein